METEKGTVNIFLLQLTQSKAVVLFLVVIVISYFGRINFAWSLIFEYFLYGSIYFTVFLIAIALTTSIHERGHITKLKELGYRAINFKANRIGDVSFWIENLDQMLPDEIYLNAASPFLMPIYYAAEIIFLLILSGITIVSPFPLNLFLLVLTLLAFVSLIGSLCAFVVIHTRRTSGIVVKLARAITSKGDIDEIVTWNRENGPGTT